MPAFIGYERSTGEAMRGVLQTSEDQTEPVSKLFEPLGTADLLAHDPQAVSSTGCSWWRLPTRGRGHSRSCCNRWQGSGHQGSSYFWEKL